MKQKVIIRHLLSACTRRLASNALSPLLGKTLAATTLGSPHLSSGTSGGASRSLCFEAARAAQTACRISDSVFYCSLLTVASPRPVLG